MTELNAAFEKLRDHVTIVEQEKMAAIAEKDATQADMVNLRDEIVNLEQSFADVEYERSKLESERVDFQVIYSNYYNLWNLTRNSKSKIQY